MFDIDLSYLFVYLSSLQGSLLADGAALNGCQHFLQMIWFMALGLILIPTKIFLVFTIILYRYYVFGSILAAIIPIFPLINLYQTYDSHVKFWAKPGYVPLVSN